jgi:hypothetical protein
LIPLTKYFTWKCQLPPSEKEKAFLEVSSMFWDLLLLDFQSIQSSPLVSKGLPYGGSLDCMVLVLVPEKE